YRRLPRSTDFLLFWLFFSTLRPRPSSTLFPYTTLFRSGGGARLALARPRSGPAWRPRRVPGSPPGDRPAEGRPRPPPTPQPPTRSEEHTSELQSREKLVCRLLLEKKKNSRMPPLTRAPL